MSARMSIPPFAVESKPINTPLIHDDGVVHVVVPIADRVWNESLISLTVYDVAEILTAIDTMSPVENVMLLTTFIVPAALIYLALLYAIII